MGFSLRDERGQGVIEYILLLIVAVAIILGGLYQLNSAFKGWATNYFGNYVACLLETGDLPTISGSPGDSGVCAQFFKPFTLAEGFALKSKSGDGNSARNIAPSARGSGGNRLSGGGGSTMGESHAFRGGSGGARPTSGNKGGASKQASVYTGNTAVSSDGGGYTSGPRRVGELKTRLDNHFAFDDGREREGGRRVGTIASRSVEYGQGAKVVPFHQQIKRKPASEDDSSTNFTVSNLLRILFIAAIVIALVMFLGGQALQIGKSMES